MMPQRPAVEQLPEPLRDALNAKLVANGFSDYRALSDWLAGEGYSIGHNALWKHGSRLQASMEKSLSRARERMAIAKALQGASDDEKAALLEASEMIALDKLMDIWDDWENHDPGQRAELLPKLIRAAAEMSRSSIGTAKWKRDFEAEQKAKLQAIEKDLDNGKVSAEEALRRVREEIYGIA